MVASSFPLSQTVAEADQADLIDGEDSIEPRVKFAVSALKNHCNRDYATCMKLFAKGDDQISGYFGLLPHRIIFNVAGSISNFRIFVEIF